MSPTGFDHGQPSHDLSPDERLNLLIQQSQQMQREAIQAQLQVPPLPLVDVVVHQGDQMPRETVGEWNPISSLAQGIVSSSGEGPPSVCHGKPLANMRTDEATQPTGHHSSHPSSSSQLPMITGQDSREFENCLFRFLLWQHKVLLILQILKIWILKNPSGIPNR